MSVIIKSSSLRVCLICSSLLAASSGCQMFNFETRKSTSSLDLKSMENAGYSLDENGVMLPAPPGKSAAGLPIVVLEVRDGEKHEEKIPITPEKPLFIEDVIQDAKLVDRLGKIKVSIIRATTPTSPPVRMDVDFDSKGKNVMQEQNYALQPNDRIVVRKDDRTWIDSMLATRLFENPVSSVSF